MAILNSAPLADYVFASKYGRYLPNQGRREIFNEAIDRVIEMHREFYAGTDIEAELDFVESALKDRLVLGSQRALQFGGKPILKKHARIYNCTVSYCDRPRFFQEAFWLLLCGCGVGFSVQKHHVEKLPPINAPSPTIKTYAIPDTIEGWADSLGVLLASYGLLDESMPYDEYVGSTVIFDYSQIRPEGAPLSSGNGKAPGPEPLKNAHEQIRKLLTRVAVHGSGPVHLQPIDAYDVLMHASDAVVSGGVRRSAAICIFSPDDEDMLTAKTGDWFLQNPQRGRSNNSALLLRGCTTREQFEEIIKRTKEFGEPGFIWADSLEFLANPCVEIGFYAYDDQGRSGWAFCNLCEVNAAACGHDHATWERAMRAAALLGTMQAGYTNFDYLGEVSEEIAKREALLGVSMTGMMDNPDFAFDPALQTKHAKLVLEVNDEFAPRIGVRRTARATCVKPAGSTSCILGTASGIHAHHAKRYFRRAQANRNEEPLQFYALHNPRAVERSVWSANDSDMVITFCIEISDDSMTKDEVSALDLLKRVKSTQQHWVDAGRVPERCAKDWISHNVSNTVNVKDEEWPEVADFIYENRAHFTGIALLNHQGDLDYPQAPFCAVKDEQEILDAYGPGALLASGLIVDGLHAFSNNLWAACDCALGIGERLDGEPKIPTGAPEEVALAYKRVHDLKKDWCRRFEQFASRYFHGNMKRTAYCLKDTSNMKLWMDLVRDHQDVDYTQLKEDSDNTKVSQTVACAGGACSVSYA